MEKYGSDEPDAFCPDHKHGYHWQINVSYSRSPGYIWRYTTSELIELLASARLHKDFSEHPDVEETIARFEKMYVMADAEAEILAELRYPGLAEEKKRKFGHL